MYKLVILVFLISWRNILGLRNDFQGNNMADITTSSNDVSVKFYQIIAKGNENVLFCPLSLNILLALTTTAARGNTSEELKSALHLGIDNKDIELGYQKILHMLSDDSLKIATRMFPTMEVSIEPQFVTSARKFFNSEVQKIDYTEREKAAEIINTFVEENTNHKIHGMVDGNSLSDNTLLLLVNAVYFKEDWRKRFEHTSNATFHLSKGKKVQTEMMKSVDYYNYGQLKYLDARVLQIPYKNEDCSMLIILPNRIDGLHKVEKRMKFVNFKIINGNLTKTFVSLEMPKFKMEKTLNLKDVCEQLGIKSMFQPEADLSGLADDRKLLGTDTALYVSEIIQKTFIQVDEKGVEATAASGMFASVIPVSVGPQPTIFRVDHPFIFVLMKGEMVLFLGRLYQI